MASTAETTENGNALASIPGTAKRIIMPRTQDGSMFSTKGRLNNNEATKVNRAILVATRSVTVDGARVNAIRGLETITAHRNAVNPYAVMRVRVDGAASCHSRCQSAISGSKTRATVG